MIDNKRITINAKTVVDGTEIASYSAAIDVETNDVSFYNRHVDKNACKEHRDEVRADQAHFEDFIYELQEFCKPWRKLVPVDEDEEVN